MTADAATTAATPVDTHVVVVGAGPVGLMLAGELRLGGADVTVLEQRETPTTESRASTLHARTMEILRQRGLLTGPGHPGPDQVPAPGPDFGTPPAEPMGHFGGLPMDLCLDGPYPGQWKVPQTDTEELLHTWATGLGADVRRGHRVTALTQHDDHVTVRAERTDGRTTEITARYVAGCDGEQSAVRRLGGFAFPGDDAERELIRADVAGIDIPDRRFERLGKGLAIAARRPDGVTRVMVHEFGRAPRRDGEASFADIAEAWRAVTGEDITGGTPLWVNAFGDASRQASAYRRGRLFLAGDAAHAQMPIGGQALNLGLQDAVNLGWKLAATIRATAPEGLLDTYHDERHTVGARVLSHIRAQARLLLGGPEVNALRRIMGKLIGYDSVRRHLAGTVSGLDIRYPDAPADGPSGQPHPLTGTRLPDIALSDPANRPRGSTLDLLRPARGVLLVLTRDPRAGAQLAEAAASFSTAVDVVTAAPADAGGPLADTGAVLVRPDGYLAWAGTAPEYLTAALTRWFADDTAHRHTTTSTTRAPSARPAPAPRRAHPHPYHPSQGNGRRDTMGKLTGKTALVTGASRGMGRATAERLAREGALVAVHYSTGADAAAEVVAGIENDGGRAFAVRAELGVAGDVHALFLALEEGLKERTGSTELNILVNNAGVMGGVKAEDTTPEQFDRLFAVNAKAPFFLIQRALTNIPDGGRIINISSGLTRFANPDEIAYAMSKGAVEMLALHYAKLLGPRNITINSVAPGITRNDNPLFSLPEAVEAMSGLSAFNRVGEPGDVADVVTFLATDDARWITGSFVDATGGTLLG